MSKDKKSTGTDFDGTGLTSGEKRSGSLRYSAYKDKYHIDNISDLQLLNELVFFEALQVRYKKQIEKFSNSITTSEAPKIPTATLKTLNDNLAQIITLKKELGLIAEENKGDDPFTYIQQLKKKFAKWRENNQASRTIKCTHCSKMIMLKIKTDIWEAQKHPYFKDQVLYNEHLVKLFKEGKINKEDVGKILGCSPFYISWLIEKWHSVPVPDKNPDTPTV